MSTQSRTEDVINMSPEAIRKGLPAAYIDGVAASGVDRARVMRLVGAPSTLRRRIKENGQLSRDESDRLARLARVIHHAGEVFGSPDKAARWLVRPSRTRPDGSAPIDLLDTDPGTEWVEERLIQIAHGMFA